MATITSLTTSPSNVIPYPMEGSTIALGHAVTANALLVKGTPVKLNADGTVAPIAAVADVFYGVVYTGNKANGNGTFTKVVVQTKFKYIVVGQAAGIVATGALVDAAAFDATAGLGDYTTTVVGGNKAGQAIVGGADNTPITVGIY